MSRLPPVLDSALRNAGGDASHVGVIQDPGHLALGVHLDVAAELEAGAGRICAVEVGPGAGTGGAAPHDLGLGAAEAVRVSPETERPLTTDLGHNLDIARDLGEQIPGHRATHGGTSGRG